MITAHTVSSYERELKHLENLILGMGLYGISQLERALAALEGRDAALSASVIAGDVREDTLASEVDRLVVQLIALRQPAASDLRHIVSAFKSAVHLERIGDYAVNIAKRSLVMPGDWSAERLMSIPRMGRLALELLRNSIKAYREKDPVLAEATWAGDEALDAEAAILLGGLLAGMKSDPSSVETGTHLMFIAKNLERIGDHATNICELVYYRISGEHLPARKPRGDAVAQEKAPAGFPEGASIQEPGSDLLSH